jgi:hypothetical protein
MIIEKYKFQKNIFFIFITLLFTLNSIVIYAIDIKNILPIHINYILIGSIFFLFFIIKNKIHLTMDRYYLSIVVVWLYNIISIFYTTDFIFGIKALIILSIIVYSFFFLFKPLYNEKNIQLLIIIIAIINIIYLLLQFINIENNYNHNGLIFVGMEGNRHNLSLHVAFSIMILFNLFYHISSYIIKFLSIIFIFFSFYILFLSFGRAGILILFIYFFIILISFLNSVKLLYKYIFIVFLTIVIVSVMYFYLQVENNLISWSLERGLTGRDIIQNKLLNLLNSNPISWFTGFGIGSIDGYVLSAFPNKVGMSIKDAGNVYSLLIQYGTIGLVLYGTFIIYYIKSLFIIFKNKYKYRYFLLIPLPFLFLPSDSLLIGYSHIITIMMYLIISICFKVKNNV